MNQWQYDTIVMLIRTGAPALANELTTAFKELVEEYLKLKENATEKTEEQ